MVALLAGCGESDVQTERIQIEPPPSYGTGTADDFLPPERPAEARPPRRRAVPTVAWHRPELVAPPQRESTDLRARPPLSQLPGGLTGEATMGGGLEIDPEGRFAVIASPLTHTVHLVRLPDMQVRRDIPLNGATPWRVVLHEDRAYVTLRGAGAVAEIEVSSAQVKATWPVCGAPRGLALDGAHLRVACAGGELVTLHRETGDVVRRTLLEPDLRDVVVREGRVYVSVFRAAEILVVQDERLADRWRLLPREREPDDLCPPSVPSVAWRLREVKGSETDALVVLHQLSATELTASRRGGQPQYYNPPGCTEPLVDTVLSVLNERGETVRQIDPAGVAMGVDLAQVADGWLLAAGTGMFRLGPGGEPIDRPTQVEYGEAVFAVGADRHDRHYALAERVGVWERRFDGNDGHDIRRHSLQLNMFVGASQVDATLWAGDDMDPGRTLFHSVAARSQVACASCHPEGGDDGLVWVFPGVGARRSQHLRGGLIGTEPFHWAGDITDIDQLLQDVMVGRMGHPAHLASNGGSLLHWLDRLPRIQVSPVHPPDAIARGEALFTESGCAGCHGMRDERPIGVSFDVGTGEPLQVPPLAGIAARPPYLHNGCAPTLRDRFGDCGGGDDHGLTSVLDDAELDDLIAYLRTL